MELIKLNGRHFECHKSAMRPVAITGCNRNEIFNFYERPSITKVELWNAWCDWCEEANKNGMKCGLQIYSANAYCFSIIGSIEYNGVTFGLWITRDHNRCSYCTI